MYVQSAVPVMVDLTCRHPMGQTRGRIEVAGRALVEVCSCELGSRRPAHVGL